MHYLLRLRKILLSNYLYISILIIVISISIVKLLIPKESKYNIKENSFIFIIDKYNIDNDKLTIYLKGKETVIGTYYFKNEEKFNLKLGDQIKVIGTLKEPEINKTDNLFNYKNYLYNKNIFYLLEINNYKKINNNHNIIYSLKSIIRKRMNNNRYLYTFILGDKSLLTTEVINSYQENGISHLFAISGMHITLLSGILLKILKKLKVTENKRYFITILFLLLYLLIADKSPSIIRGVLFFILFSINNIYYFYIKPYNLFIIALSISLLINPFYIYDIGFQYSFLISLSLLLTSNYLKSNNYFIGLLKVSLISTFISIPIQIYHFYQLNLLSLINNLIFVPIISIIIFPMSLIVLLFKPLEIVYNILTNLLEKLSIFISHISTFKLAFIKLPSIIYILYFLLIVISLYLLIYKNKKYLLLITILLLFIHSNYNLIIRTKYLEVIDVGQGDSFLLHLNNKNILIDTGGKKQTKRIKNSSIVNNTTIPLLKSLGIKKINYLILSHGDKDHMGESINLVNNYKVDKVIFNCGTYNYLEKDLIKVLNKKKIKYYSCINELNINNNKLYFLQTKLYDNENDNSNVIYTEINNNKFLFMGDASITTEKEILKEYNLSNIDVLKVGHHGSKTSSGKEFIDIVNPNYSIISVGKDNRYGHPNKEVLKTLKESKIYRTDQDGSVMFIIKNNKLKMKIYN